MVKSHKLIYHLIIVYLVQNEVLAEEEEEILVVLYSKKIPTCKNKTQKCYRLWLSKIQKRNSTIELTLKSELHIIWWTIQLLVFDKIKLLFDYQLKYQFWKKSLPKNATLSSWTPGQRFNFPKWLCYKIHTFQKYCSVRINFFFQKHCSVRTTFLLVRTLQYFWKNW